MVFPWQIQQWQQLWKAKQENRLPHALMFTGISGSGKTLFAESFIRAQDCQHVSDNVSNHEIISRQCQCHHCCLISGKVHPNILWVEPEKEGGIIKIDQIREVNEFISQTSLQGDYRFAIISPANHMNANAANALLKTLEEPSSGAILLLICDQASRLPATIRSRCQQIHFPRPQTEIALTWLNKQLPADEWDNALLLKLANGAPLAAVELTKSGSLTARQDLLQILTDLMQQKAQLLQAAAAIQQMDLIKLVDNVLTWVMDLLRLKFNGKETDILNKDFFAQLSLLQKRLSLSPLLRFMDFLKILRGQIGSGMNLNKQLVAENVLVRYINLID